MLCLRTLGGLALERGYPPLTPSGPRRRLLALLALIAGHDPPGISRDKLLAYLWPESDSRHARNSLKQALHSLRQSLGTPLVNCTGGNLRLDPTLIEVDLWRFEAALAHGNETAAAGIYLGPYLDGFYLTGLPEFERWVEAERERLARRYGDALRVLAERADANRDTLASAIWWRRLTVADPLCSTAALGLMRALAAAGDVSSAREHARAHAAYVRAELGGPAAEAVVAFANRLRSDPVAGDATPSPSRSETSALSLTFRGPERRSGAVAAPVAAAMKSTWVLSLPPVPRVAWWATAALWAVALLLIPFCPQIEWPLVGSIGSGVPVTVAVMPFTVTGGPETMEFGRGLEELVASRLDGADGLRTVSAGSAAALMREGCGRAHQPLPAIRRAVARRGARIATHGGGGAETEVAGEVEHGIELPGW
jgi:DNA-binding SARP family transcriptional activator